MYDISSNNELSIEDRLCKGKVSIEEFLEDQSVLKAYSVSSKLVCS